MNSRTTASWWRARDGRSRTTTSAPTSTARRRRPTAAAGIEVYVGSGNTIGGLTSTPGTGAGNLISGNTASGVYLDDPAGGNLVEGNLIGTDVTGTVALANGMSGVQVVGSSGNTVGGLTSTARNIISGNATKYGVVINGSGGASNNLVVGNYIGTNAAGTAGIPNSLGVNIWNGATDNTIGGTGSAGNLISGNATDGIDIDGSSTTDNLVEGNDLGTNQALTAAVGNASSGISVYGSSTGNTITGNIAAGNVYGISLDGASGNLVMQNLVGVTAATGGMVLANQSGVLVQAGSTSNTIGGSSYASANVISGNTVDGMTVGNTGTSGNVVEYNYIGTDSANDTALGNSTGILFFGDADGGPTDNTIGPKNIISGNTYAGVGIYDTGTSDNVVAGNLIGTNTAGTVALANVNGVIIGASATANTIGGSTSAAANIISGNTQKGIEITDSGTSDNVVAGNTIGLNSSGTALANGGVGVDIVSSASANTIGGPSAGYRNVISGNSGGGIYLFDSTDDLIAGNYIGTDAAGTVAISNTLDGIDSGNGTGITIGGTTSAARNVIAGNGSNNVEIDSDTADVVAGNYIGTDKTGTVALGGGADGVQLNGGLSDTIGGTVSGAGNLISGNTTNGVEITGNTSNGNVVAGNLIGTDVTGTVALPNAFGITFDLGASDNTIGGIGGFSANVISGNSQYGIYFTGTGASANVFEGNLIGTNEAGTAALANSYGFFFFGNSGNTIGGTAAGAGNVVSGNTYSGISVQGAFEVIVGNLIGTDYTGTVAIGNGYGDGVDLYSADNTVGGTAMGAGNVISGNATGVYIGADDNLVEGNLIGTDITGTVALGNTEAGMIVDGGAIDNTIGGTASGAGNLISGNVGDGIAIDGTGTTGNVVLGNKIGTDLAGTVAVPNTVVGVDIYLGPTANTIGGTAAGAGNLISGNTLDGVDIVGAGASENVVLGNYIGTDVTGTVAIANDGVGVGIFDGATDNTIGGAASARPMLSPGTRATACRSTTPEPRATSSWGT